jgi:SAM-dependent methyltransferase
MQRVTRELEALAKGPGGRLADFGCSSGFLLAELRATLFADARWELVGLDFIPKLLDQARARGIPGCSFEHFDMCRPDSTWADAFDLVLCLETLEHTGDYREAIRNLVRSCRRGGHILITAPNERGFPGVAKFLARKAVRRQPYGDFFAGQSESEYLRALLRGQNLERFRDPPRLRGWGPHLGFDIRELDRFLTDEFLTPGLCRLAKRTRIALNFGSLYLLERLA